MTVNQRVAGSSPAGGAKQKAAGLFLAAFLFLQSMVQCLIVIPIEGQRV